MATEAPIQPVWGVPVAALDLPAASGLVVERSLAGTGGFACLCNVHVLVTAQHSEPLRAALGEAALVFADGWPVAWSQRRAGSHRAMRVAGGDLVAAVFELGEPIGLRHALLGSTPHVVGRLRKRLLDRFPRARIVVTVAPGAGAALPRAADLRRVRSGNPDIVWCALGAPRQELWMAREADRLAPAFVVGVGAAFDFLAETKRRAPLWMQQSGLEWLYRLLSEPKRLAGRYARTNCEFAWRTLADLTHQRGAQ